MDGMLLIDKPISWTSHDVVGKVRSTLGPYWDDASGRKLRVGHAGTLDPLASGLLIVLVGRATKQQERFMKLDKRYKADIRLGAESTTDDAEGEIIPWEPTRAKPPAKSDVIRALDRFTGNIEQVPPQYSAIKVDGQRAYKNARAGRTVELKSRRVTIHEISGVSYDYPELDCICEVSSGTYIRSLARDIGDTLGTGGYLQGLRRLQIGEWSVDQAVPPDMEAEKIMRHIQAIDS